MADPWPAMDGHEILTIPWPAMAGHDWCRVMGPPSPYHLTLCYSLQGRKHGLAFGSSHILMLFMALIFNHHFCSALPNYCRKVARMLAEGCPKIARRLPGDCSKVGRRLPEGCPKVARKLPECWKKNVRRDAHNNEWSRI